MGDVPRAIDVLGPDVLVRGSVDGLYDVAARAPGVYYESMWGGLGSVLVMRGQYQPSLAADNVGVFVDGVYQGNVQGANVYPLDLERIEIVRGPQSALYGHSSFSGSVNYVSRLPSATADARASVDAGTSGLWGADAAVSGPVARVPLLMRVAAGMRYADGTAHDATDPGQSLGHSEQRGVAISILTDPALAWRGRLSMRWTEDRSGAPASNSLSGTDFNCGGRSSFTAPWSYFCGEIPARSTFDISPGLPPSVNLARQAMLELAWPIAGATLTSFSTIYDSTTSLFRDFDDSRSGMTIGVCRVGVNCPVAGIPAGRVTRLAGVNGVFHGMGFAQEYLQELRVTSREGARTAWLIGAAFSSARSTDGAAFGFERGDLATDERWTNFIASSPNRVGALSLTNIALVDDAARTQVLRSASEQRKSSSAVFARLAVPLGAHLRLQGELRSNWERIRVTSEVANFAVDQSPAIGTLPFHDVTPRVSLDWRPTPGVLTYASAAKGSRSGGVNVIPGLIPSEQGFQPESNWTYETGLRIHDEALGLEARLTGFYIDWRDTQILGFSNTPGVDSLITRNTAGIRTHGFEFSASIPVAAGWRIRTAYSYVDPRYRAGSEDLGSSGFCGISITNQTSTFCRIGPSRDPASDGTLAPYIDGNLSSRVPPRQWNVGLDWQSAHAEVGTWLASVDLQHQDDVYDRPVGGASFGHRTLLQARLEWRGEHWAVALWGRNLTDETYIRGLATRQPAFYRSEPRPLDLVYGDGRRWGATVSYRH